MRLTDNYSDKETSTFTPGAFHSFVIFFLLVIKKLKRQLWVFWKRLALIKFQSIFYLTLKIFKVLLICNVNKYNKKSTIKSFNRKGWTHFTEATSLFPRHHLQSCSQMRWTFLFQDFWGVNKVLTFCTKTDGLRIRSIIGIKMEELIISWG